MTAASPITAPSVFLPPVSARGFDDDEEEEDGGGAVAFEGVEAVWKVATGAGLILSNPSGAFIGIGSYSKHQSES